MTQESNYKIVNPAAANIYFDNAGVATTATTQPTINVGRAHNLGTSGSTQSVGMNELLLGDRGRTVFGSQVVMSARQSVQGADYSGSTAITSAADSSGLTDYTKTTHNLAVGTSIIVGDTNGILSGPQRIVSVPDANSFITDKPYVTGAGTLTYGVNDGDFATMTAGRYVARRLNGDSAYLRGIASTILQSGASDYQIRRSIHKVETAFRHDGVATAMRAGYWDAVNGVFTTAPTATNDSVGNVAGSTVTDGTADHAATPSRAVPGELVYREGGKPSASTSAGSGVRMDDYKATTG